MTDIVDLIKDNTEIYQSYCVDGVWLHEDDLMESDTFVKLNHQINAATSEDERQQLVNRFIKTLYALPCRWVVKTKNKGSH